MNAPVSLCWRASTDPHRGEYRMALLVFFGSSKDIFGLQSHTMENTLKAYF